MNREPYPLQWPPNVPRTPDNEREDGRFDATIADALNGIVYELERFGASEWTVTSNASLNRNLSIRSKQPGLEDLGVAVYFTIRGIHRCIAIDRYKLLAHNLRAIHRTLEAMRGIERWGARSTIDATMAGFVLPEGGTAWYEVLGVPANASAEQVTAAYKRLVKTHHPDTGGDHDAFVALQDAYREGLSAHSAP